MVGSTFSHADALSALLEALDEGALLFDEARVCRAAGRRAAEIIGVDARALIGQPRAAVVALFAGACEAPADVTAALADDAVGDARTTIDPIELNRPPGHVVAWSSVPLVTSTGAIGGRVDVLREVTRERRAEARLDEVSTVDEPTGLMNRRAFEREADREHRRCQRAWVSYAVVRLQVHGPGGASADAQRVRALGESLRASRREYDLVARWGEDGLAMLLPGADAASTKLILDRCVASANELVGAGDPPLTLGAAVWIPPSGDGALDMMARAEEALAAAVARGRGKVRIDAGFGQWKDEPTT
ncbi:MAG TPA: diguanylate cyclase [Byssovorax sp.]|jgi:GGDEF domain-containing protein